MPQRDLMRTEFFNDFLARDGLHWGVNVYSYAGQRNIGDLRIWRGRRRENFDLRTLELLRLVEPAFTGALMRAGGAPAPAMPEPAVAPRLSQREHEVAMMICEGLPDKAIALRLGVEPSTVRTYLKRIFGKLGVHRRSEVAADPWRDRDNAQDPFKACYSLAGGGIRPNSFSSPSPIASSRRSLPAGPSSSMPTGNLLVAPERDRNLNAGDAGIAAGIGVLDIEDEIGDAGGVGIGRRRPPSARSEIRSHRDGCSRTYRDRAAAAPDARS